jgi:hypothetical protein
MTNKLKIKNRFNDNLICEEALENIKQLAEKNKVNLWGADLRGADLGEANLRGADLREANLRGADLRRADLRGANLWGADLREANLRGADLGEANLRGADLGEANLWGANLRGADLREADLWGAENIPDFYINNCKRDILSIFNYLPNEVKGLREKIIKGQIDGSQYEGDCCCLIGSLGNESAVCSIPYYEKGLHNFGEQLFSQIREGDTPETNQFSKIALELCDEFINKIKD